MKTLIPERFWPEYQNELSNLFYTRINLFCYISIIAFTIEVICSFIPLFRGLISVKDMPGIIGGIFFSIVLLATGKINKTIQLQKARAFFFTFLLILIAVLAATAHPVLITYLGVSLVLMAFFTSVLLLPWGFFEAMILGAFAVVNFIWIYLVFGTFVDSQIFGINIIVLCFNAVIGAVVKRSETVLRQKDFASRKEVEEKNSIMSKELDLARKIHKSIIPHSVKSDSVDIAVTYNPMLYMGGDYAKFHFINKNKLGFVLADVTGHGVSSALLVNRIHTEVERLIREDLRPGDILKALDDFINRDFGKMGFYLTAFCGVLEINKKTLTYSNYGHPPQMLLQSKNKNIILMKAQTFLMGIGMDTGGIYNAEVNFEKGDRLILFTDGIIEAKDKNNEFFGHDRLESFAKNNTGLDVVEFNSKLIKELDAFQEGKQSDDIFILTIQTK